MSKGVKLSADSLSKHIRTKSPVLNGKIKVKDEGDPYDMYNLIIKKMYIGGEDGAKNKKFFTDHKIKAVLNCTHDIPNYFINNPSIEYLRIPVIDNLKENQFKKMEEFMPLAIEFISKHIDGQKNNVYIHCAQGKSRSCAAAAAYLMDKKGLNPYEACSLILEKRPEAFFYGTSLNFDQALVNHYKTKTK